jgi:hypothetical protein
MSGYWSTGDRIVLATVGVAATTVPNWRGGRGVFINYGVGTFSTTTFQFSPDNGFTWVDVPAEGGAGGAKPTLMDRSAFNFCLPPCALRVVNVDANMSCLAVGI